MLDFSYSSKSRFFYIFDIRFECVFVLKSCIFLNSFLRLKLKYDKNEMCYILTGNENYTFVLCEKAWFIMYLSLFLHSYFVTPFFHLGPLATRTASPTTTAKNHNKYNNCMLECIELGTCTELSLKLERKKTFFGVLGTTRT